MFSFFKKKIVMDNRERVYLDEDGEFSWSLKCDQALMKDAIENIRNIFARCIDEEKSFSDRDDVFPFTKSTIYFLGTLNIKQLGSENILSYLELILTNNSSTTSASRFLDAITLINLTTPPEAIEALKGRFLYTVLYEYPVTVDGQPLIDKADWLYALGRAPFIPLLPLFQELLINLVEDTARKVALANLSTDSLSLLK